MSVVKRIKDIVDVLVGDYPQSQKLSETIIPQLKDHPDKLNRSTFVKATMTDWYWGKESLSTQNLAKFIINECHIHYPQKYFDKNKSVYIMQQLWANIYHKGDYADSHAHSPAYYSFVYFLKSKWYHSPIVFTKSNQKIRPKEGRYVIFPGNLKHNVPKHRYNEERITISGNITINQIVKNVDKRKVIESLI